MKRRYGVRSKKRTTKRRKCKMATLCAVKKLISADVEKKWASFQATPAPTNAAPVNYVLNNLVQGDSRNTRTGNQTHFQHVHIKAWIQASLGIPDGQMVRVMLFWDKQADGAAPTFAQLFADPTLANNYMSPRNPDYLRRYIVLRDKTFIFNTLCATATTPATGLATVFSQQQHVLNWSVNLKNKRVQYNDVGGGTVADIIGPSLYLFWMTDIGTAPLIDQMITTQFTDA